MYFKNQNQLFYNTLHFSHLTKTCISIDKCVFIVLFLSKNLKAYENAKQNHKTTLSVNMESDNVYRELLTQSINNTKYKINRIMRHIRKYIELFFIISIGSLIGICISMLLTRFNTSNEILCAIILAMSIIITVLIWLLCKTGTVHKSNKNE